MKPAVRPGNPLFSSGPCSKRPGWTPDALAGAYFGRSHRAREPLARIRELLDLSRALLGLPDEWRLGIVPGSDTGAIEMAMWSLLGPRGSRLPELGQFRRAVGVRRRARAAPAGCARDRGALRLPARPPPGRSRARHGVRLERHHLRRAGARCRLDRRRPRGPHPLRRHLRGSSPTRWTGPGSMPPVTRGRR